MRFIDKFHEKYGDRVQPYGGVYVPDGESKCPSDYGYEPDKYACDEMRSCAECWEREM